jgi:Flp pilus assembly protein TadB
MVSAHDWLSLVTFALFIVAMLWIVVALHRNGSAKKPPEGVDTSTGLRLYRAELERQYGVVKSVWWWYLAPMIPGFIVYTIGNAVKVPLPAAWAGLAVMDIIVAGLFYVVWRMNMRAARCLQRMIEELKVPE